MINDRRNYEITQNKEIIEKLQLEKKYDKYCLEIVRIKKNKIILLFFKFNSTDCKSLSNILNMILRDFFNKYVKKFVIENEDKPALDVIKKSSLQTDFAVKYKDLFLDTTFNTNNVLMKFKTKKIHKIYKDFWTFHRDLIKRNVILIENNLLLLFKKHFSNETINSEISEVEEVSNYYKEISFFCLYRY